jgi:hypothetical protein
MNATVKTIPFQKHQDVMSLKEARVSEPLRGSDLDPRISYPPLIVKSDWPKQSQPEQRSTLSYFGCVFVRSIANSRQKLMRLVVRIKELLRAPGTL